MIPLLQYTLSANGLYPSYQLSGLCIRIYLTAPHIQTGTEQYIRLALQPVSITNYLVLIPPSSVLCYDRFFPLCFFSSPYLFSDFPHHSSLLPEGGIHHFYSPIISDLYLHRSVLLHQLRSSFYSSPSIMFSLVL